MSTHARPGKRGSRSDPFPTPQALLDFLNKDKPEQYVFRGQTREYSGPVLSAAFRDGFKPFSPRGKRGRWAGITLLRDEKLALLEARRRDLGPSHLVETLQNLDSTAWDLKESDYQAGFDLYFRQPAIKRHRTLGPVLRDNVVQGLMILFGDDIGSLLAQQYGLTSMALDASRDPVIALFFATRSAPFYDPVGESGELGVVYRWPRERAMLADDLLLPLEQDSFESCVSSLRHFIEASDDLRWFGPQHYEMEEGQMREVLNVISFGESRDVTALAIPDGSFNRSRSGRQKAALLWPDCQPAEARFFATEKPGGNLGLLVGDLMMTHGGEAMYFRHSSDATFLSEIDKFALWPSLSTATDHFQLDHFRPLPYTADQYRFEDVYLEFMLRFFSSCSPVEVSIFEMLHEEAPDSFQLNNSTYVHIVPAVHGVIDLGFLVHPADADAMVNRLTEPVPQGASRPRGHMNASSSLQSLMPPVLRYVHADHVKPFRERLYSAFAKRVN